MSSPSAALEAAGALAVKPLPHPSFFLGGGGGRGKALQVLRYHSLTLRSQAGAVG